MDKNYFAITDTGRVRDNNEDAFIAEKTADGEVFIACVIDGVGGYAGGEIASEIARKSIIRQLNTPNGELTAQMKTAIILAEEEILAEKVTGKGHEKMACVLTLAIVDQAKNQFHYAHVGDTRLYLLRDQSLVKISKDQSFVGFMEDSGRITEQQAMSHPKRNEINKALGFGHGLATQPDYIEMGSSPFLPGDMLLICSDGLSDMLTRQQMADVLTSGVTLEEMGRRLVSAANDNGGRDNITLVLVKNDKAAIKHGATKPARKNQHTLEEHLKTETGVSSAQEDVSSSTAASDSDATAQSAADNIKKRNPITVVLAVLCVLLLASTAYLLWEKHIAAQKANAPGTLQPHQLPPEILLPDTLAADTFKTDSLKKTDSLIKPATR